MISVRRPALRTAPWIAVPGILVAASYLWLAWDHGAIGLWHVIVHESGRYTFAQTIAYASHFLREVPVDTAMGLLLAAAFLDQDDGPTQRIARKRAAGAIALGIAIALVVAAILIEAHRTSLSSAWTDLLQFRTRDDTHAFGSHWRYHLLHTMWFGVAAAPVAAFALGSPHQPAPRSWASLLAWGYVAAVTLACGFSLDFATDVRFAAHQARELATHVPITLPLTVAALLAMTGRRTGGPTSGRITFTVARALVLVAIPAWLFLIVARGNPASEAQTGQGLSAIIAGHVFEHAPDYLFTPCVAIAALMCFPRRPRPQRSSA